MTQRVGRREFLWKSLAGATAGALGLSATGCLQEKPQPERPNIVFLFTDDQRFSTLHALNNPAVQTPTMDRLMERGTTFTRAHIMGGTIGAVCAPSRAMMLTGQTLFHVDASIVRPQQAAPGSAKPYDLYPEALRRAGYRTFGTGKWHNGPQTYARCFTDGASIMFGGMSDHLKVPIQDFDPEGKYPKERTRVGEKFSSELFTDAAVGFLENHKSDEPFFLYVAYTSPHDPRMAPQKYVDLYPPENIAVPENFLPKHPFDNGEMKIRDENLAPFPRTPEEVKKHIAGYYAMITEVDAQMGRIVEALEKTGKVQNTVIVFAADNGLAVGQHGLMGKQNLYEHSVRVPLVIGGPGIPAGLKRDAFVYLFDLFPTLCELAGLPVPSTVEGKSLVPTIADNTPVRDSVFYAYRNIQRGVCDGQWKLILYQVNGKETTQLFDLAADPLERKNLAEDAAHADRIRALRARLKEWMRSVDDPMDIDKPLWGQAPA
jgi:arylsulfatase A-like enzyme